ncbi:MAG: hypothetical protein BEN18_03960 [Epulopiscium sp. Nuni2H_MBin001]|nr:MAG: hypothetical protein BEN18_03960 [Epulopiscium sp. Nuni2H_MBin001]
MQENKDYLIDLDSVVGDGDLGLTMSDGFTAAYKKIKDTTEADIGKTIYQAGKAMSTAVPSTMGTLMASGLMEAGKNLKGKTELDNSDIALLFKSYFDGVAKRGKAKLGDKTFLDGLGPAVDSMNTSVSAGDDLKTMATKAFEAATKGFDDTTKMKAVHGRAAIRGEESRSLQDPGAAVATLIIKALCNSVE